MLVPVRKAALHGGSRPPRNARMPVRQSLSLVLQADEASTTKVGTSAAVVVFGVGLAILRWPRRCCQRLDRSGSRTFRRATRSIRVVKPPTPAFWKGRKDVIDATPPRFQKKTVEIQPDPRQVKLEAALSADSLRSLCLALKECNGNISPPPGSPVQTTRPILNAPLTVRSFLRFIQLRHGESDDLIPNDFRGNCGQGIQVLMTKCRKYEYEIIRALALETRADDAVAMVRAFHDLTDVLKKFMPFLRKVIELATPAMLARRREPLSRLISFLEPYGTLQLKFLYEAAMDSILHIRIKELDLAQLVDTVEDWMRRARSENLAPILQNQIRLLVLKVSCMQQVWGSIDRRAQWVAAVLWASLPEMTDALKTRETKVLQEGLVQQGDPGDLLDVTLLLCTEGAQLQESYKLLGALLLDALASAGPRRAREVLQDFNIRSTEEIPLTVVELIIQATDRFSVDAPFEELERLVARWAARFGTAQPRFVKGMTKALVERGVAPSPAVPPGPCVRTAGHLLDLGIDTSMLTPLIEHMLGQPQESWSLRHVDDHARVPETLRILHQLWRRPDQPIPCILEAEAVLQLVGPAQVPPREADAAANSLSAELAAQLTGLSDRVVTSVRQWRTEAGNKRLAAVLAPLVLEVAHDSCSSSGSSSSTSSSSRARSPDGDLARSASILADALAGATLGVQQAEWVLQPFATADVKEQHSAVNIVATACARGDAPVAPLEDAFCTWLNQGAPSKGLGRQLLATGLVIWERDGTRGAGLETLRQVYAWLEPQAKVLTDLLHTDEPKNRLASAVQQVATLLNIVDGSAPSLHDLKRARSGLLGNLGLAGKATLADLVSEAWSRAIPGMNPAAAGTHFDLWWARRLDDQSMMDQLVWGVIDDLAFANSCRTQATWGSTTPPNMMGTPAWRVDYQAGYMVKVPWFVPESVIKEAQSGERPKKKTEWIKDKRLLEEAKRRSGARCMYCGSPDRLHARMVWPGVLGGTKMISNLASCCPLCADLQDVLGPARFSEVCNAEPEEAAEVWWLAQKKANMQTMEFLAAEGRRN